MNEYDKIKLYNQIKQDLIKIFKDKKFYEAFEKGEYEQAVKIMIKHFAVLLSHYGNYDFLNKYLDYERKTIGFMMESTRKNKEDMQQTISQWANVLYLIDIGADPKLVTLAIQENFGKSPE